MHIAATRFALLDPATGKISGPRINGYTAVCCCGWEGPKQDTAEAAQADGYAHERAVGREFPLDSYGRPLAWPDPHQPGWYIDAWNGVYGSRDEALSESRDWVATEAERVLAYGEPMQPSEDA